MGGLIFTVWILQLVGWSFSIPLHSSQGVDPFALEWLTLNVQSNLNYLLNPEGICEPISRDIPNGALAALLLADPNALGSNGSSLKPGDSPCITAIQLLHQFGVQYDMSFGGQAIPMIYNNYLSCFNSSELAWFEDAINASLPQTQIEATSSDISYGNMHIMGMTATILFGELALPFAGARASNTAAVGYRMLEDWVDYTVQAGMHEFNSPTYTFVQLTSLYTGYILSTNSTARRYFEYGIDTIWATTAANSFSGVLSGAHSRDYDTLLGHGMLMIEMFLWGLPGARPLECEYRDPHCEGAPDSAVIGNGEPMTVTVLSLYNALHPQGYKIKDKHFNLAQGETREVRSPYIAFGDQAYATDGVTANGQQAIFAESYNFVQPGAFAIGSASQEYIANTHSKYYPNPQSKLFSVVLGDPSEHVDRQKDKLKPKGSQRQLSTTRIGSIPAISIVPDWMDSPYGIWMDYGPWKDIGKTTHLALHPGMVQHREALLATVALNGNDDLDGFTITDAGNLYPGLATNVILPRYADEYILVYPNDEVIPWSVPSDGTAAFEHEIPLGTTVALRVGNGSLALRVFTADAIDSATGGTLDNETAAKILLKGDESGLDLAAIRLVAYHMEQKPSNDASAFVNITASHVQFNALFVAAECQSRHKIYQNRCTVELAKRVAAASVATSISTTNSSPSFDKLRVSARVDVAEYNNNQLRIRPLELAVERNLTCDEKGGYLKQTAHTQWNCLLDRQVDGKSAIPPEQLEVNGVAVVDRPR